MPLVLTCYNDTIKDDMKKYNIVRDGTNQPELRQALIHEMLKKYDMEFVKSEYDRTVLTKTHTAGYIKFLENCYSSFEKYDDEEYIRDNDSGIIPANFTNKKYNDELPYYKRLGFYATDVTTPIYKNTFDVIKTSAILAKETTKYVKKHKTIYLSTTNPSHHASRRKFGGYCFVNVPCMVIMENINNYDDLCVLDLDYHAGDGTHEIIKTFVKDYPKKNFFSVSIHADPKYDYPSFSGYESENDENIHNIIFPKKADVYDYIMCLGVALDKIKKKLSDKMLLVIPFGADTYKKDIDVSSQYGCNLEIDDYVKIGKLIRKSMPNNTIIVTQEGGYYLDDVPQIVDNFLSGLD